MAKKIYKFVETRDLIFNVPFWLGKFTNGFLELDGYTIKVYGSHLKGYAWDGCSPKVEFLDLYLGTPDGVVRKQHVEQSKYEGKLGVGKVAVEISADFLPKTYYASLLHDLLYQYKNEVPVSRLVADKIFYEMLKRARFKPAGLYYFMVRLFGGLYGKWKTK